MSKQSGHSLYLSNCDFDKLLTKEDDGARAKLSSRFKSFLKSFDLLLKTSRKLTDIHDENRNLLEKLSSSAHRRYTFKRLRKQTSICINDLVNASALVDEQYVFSRFQRTSNLLKKLMNSWDIMLHSIEILAKNPNICTNLSDEIKLFHTIASTDMEEYLEEFTLIKEEVMLRVPFCQLSNDEENNLQIIHGSGLFELKELRFDRLIQADQSQIYCDLEERGDALGKLVVRKKRIIPFQGFEGVSPTDKDRSESYEVKSSFNDISSYVSNDVAETGTVCGTIVRETFTDKESYIEAWAENQARINLPCQDSLQIDSLVIDPICNVHDDNSLTQISSTETCPFAWTNEGLAGLSSKRSYDESFCIMHKEEPLEFGDELMIGTERFNINVPGEEESLQGKSECCQNTNFYLINPNEERHPHSINIDVSKEDINFDKDIVRSSEPKIERISIPRELVKVSNENLIYIKKGKVENSEPPINVECPAIGLEDCRKHSCFNSEPSVLSPLKITLVRLGCYNWTVKQDDVHCDRKLERAGTVRKATLHKLDEKAIERMKILNRVKQVLAHEKSSKTIKLKSTRRFKALKQKAATLYSMKSQIIGRKQG